MKRLRNLFGRGMILTGICLMLFSAWFLLRYLSNVRDMEENADQLLRELDRVIPAGMVVTEKPAYTDADSMPAIELRGISCIGKLSVPSLDLELPVANNGSDIGFTPIHISGTPSTTDFVIEALGYATQFGNLSRLELGDSIIFTDLYGIRYSYEITGIVSGTREQLKAMDDAMLENTKRSLADSSVADMGVEPTEDISAESEPELIQMLPGIETVIGDASAAGGAAYTEATTAEKQRPELLLKFRKSLRIYVRVACVSREEKNDEE